MIDFTLEGYFSSDTSYRHLQDGRATIYLFEFGDESQVQYTVGDSALEFEIEYTLLPDVIPKKEFSAILKSGGDWPNFIQFDPQTARFEVRTSNFGQVGFYDIEVSVTFTEHLDWPVLSTSVELIVKGSAFMIEVVEEAEIVEETEETPIVEFSVV